MTLSAGMLRFRWRRFLVFDAAATLIWALYAALLGYFGGRAFEHAEWKGLLLALGIGFAIGGLVEAVRWAMRRRRGQKRTPLISALQAPTRSSPERPAPSTPEPH